VVAPDGTAKKESGTTWSGPECTVNGVVRDSIAFAAFVHVFALHAAAPCCCVKISALIAPMVKFALLD